MSPTKLTMKLYHCALCQCPVAMPMRGLQDYQHLGGLWGLWGFWSSSLVNNQTWNLLYDLFGLVLPNTSVHRPLPCVFKAWLPEEMLLRLDWIRRDLISSRDCRRWCLVREAVTGGRPFKGIFYSIPGPFLPVCQLTWREYLSPTMMFLPYSRPKNQWSQGV